MNQKPFIRRSNPWGVTAGNWKCWSPKFKRFWPRTPKITHDAKLMGRRTECLRQIDVLVEDKIGQYDIRIVIDCKDYIRPVDVKGVEEFWVSQMMLGHTKRCLYARKGFLKPQKTGGGLSNGTLQPAGYRPYKWQVKATLPGLCDFREAKISFSISESSSGPFKMPGDFLSSLTVHDENKNPMTSMIEGAFKRWEAGGYPIKPGLHPDLNIFDCAKTFVDNGYGELVPVELKASVMVSQKVYFGQIPIKKISGFLDEQSGKAIVNMNAFSVGLISPVEVEKTWLLINKGDKLPAHPVLTVTGLIGYV